MTRTLIGLDYEGLGCVKITKGDFDPKTTNDSFKNRFYFNSKWGNQITTPEIEVMPLVPYGSGTARNVFTPGGSTVNTFEALRSDYRAGSTDYSDYQFRGKLRWPGIRYDLPMIDVSEIDAASGRYQQLKMTRRDFGQESGSGVRGGYVGMTARGVWHRRRVGSITGQSFNVDYSPQTISSTSETLRDLIVWNLPGNSAPLDGPTSTPSTAGKMAVQINSAACRVAKPGFDVRTATPQQLAFDSSGRPLSVVAADDIAVPVGASSYDVGFVIPDKCYIEMSCYDDTSANIFYPMKLSGDDNGYGVEYWTDDNLIRFNNTQKACRARFIAFAVDPLGPSSGTNRVLRQFTDGGEVVAQFLRPGAAATPRFSDIILDSRRPVIQILADGYFDVPDHTGSWNTPTETTVSFDAAGFFPYVKYMTVHGSGLTEEVRCPRVNRRYQNSLSTAGLSGDGSYCRYSTTSATFYTAKGRPDYQYLAAGSGQTSKFDDNPIVGIRYFVLGIPTP